MRFTLPRFSSVYGGLQVNKYGRYHLLSPESALKAYPTPRPVPESIKRPDYVPGNFFKASWGEHDEPESASSVGNDEDGVGERINLGSDDEMGVRRVGKMAGDILARVKHLIQPGVTTNEIDEAVHEMAVFRGAYPSTLGFTSYPRSCTVAVNNVLAHGIPDDRPLEPEDLINVDLTLYLDGYHGDTSATFLLPNTDDQGLELVETTREALARGIEICGPDVPINEIGRVIQDFAEKRGFSVNSQFAGHGIGKRFHQPPYIFHTHNDDTTRMQVGDCFTIEPILVQGQNSRGYMWDDGFTMSSESGARSAQFEHQILITENGADIITLPSESPDA